MNWLRIILLGASLIVMAHSITMMVIYKSMNLRLGHLSLGSLAASSVWGNYSLLKTPVTSRTVVQAGAISIAFIYVVYTWRRPYKARPEDSR